MDQRPKGEAISELEQVALLLQKNNEAWRQFVVQYSPVIRRRVRSTAKRSRFALAEAEIEDVCAEVFSTLIANEMAALRKFQGRSQLSTWLSVITHRKCLEFLNRRPSDRGVGRYDDSSDNLNVGVDGQPALERVIQFEQLNQLVQWIEQLGPADQRILRLHFQDNLSYKEIAKAMSISQNAVGPKLHRAQQRLKKLARCCHG